MPTPGALEATDRRYLGVGCFAWSRSRGHEGILDDGSQVDPVGGLVLDVSEMVDDSTGEITKAFVVADTWRGRLRLRRMPESDVDHSTMEGAAPGQIAKTIRQLCEEVAIDNRRRLRTGLFTSEHMTLLHYARRLAELLA